MQGQRSAVSDPSGYFSEQTIFSLSSPTGGAIAVFRISGKEGSGDQLIRGALPPRQAVYTRLYIEDRALDEVVCVHYPAPNSFTGEDVLEIFLHGSPRIAQRLSEHCVRLGMRQALPGEFSFRAVRNGKMVLSQAEAIHELIQAESDAALDLALEKLSGSQHALVKNLRDQLLQLATLSELGIDFSDQDVEEVSLPVLKKRLESIQKILFELSGSFERGNRIQRGIPTSMLGLPNAGKSSLFNVLLGEDRSIVSDEAGTTRDVVRETLNLNSDLGTVLIRMADTAGLRTGAGNVETQGIARSLKSASESDAIILVIDGQCPEFEKVSEMVADILPTKKVIGVLTKMDLVLASGGQTELDSVLAKAKKFFSKTDFYWVDCKTAAGAQTIARQIANQVSPLISREKGEVLLTSANQIAAVQSAVECLKQAYLAQDSALFAADVRHALAALNPLLGETLPDDILGQIFSNFCIGK